MGQKSFIAVAVLVAAMIVGAVTVYAYDSSRDDLIAKGVSVAGVDVGGMSTAEARRVVRRRVARPLERRVTARYRSRRFELSAREAGVRVDVGGMVDAALQESRDGNIIGRVARDITGGEEDARVPARTSYSRAAVAKLVDRVERSVNRRPQDARLNFPALTKVKERKGVKVKAGSLRRRIGQALTVPGVDRELKVPTEVQEPGVTSAELADRFPHLIVVNRGGFELKLYRRLRLVKTYRIGVGQVGYDTPAGMYHIQNKAVNPAWNVPNKPWAGSLAGQVIPGGTSQNPLKARWMGIYDGAGIHGTDQTWSLGSRASHGCIRMAIPDVVELYDRVPVQTPIYIA